MTWFQTCHKKTPTTQSTRSSRPFTANAIAPIAATTNASAISAPDPKRLTQLIAELDSPQFTVRDQASQELAAFGELAAVALHEALKMETPVEARGRLERLLRNLDELTAEQRRGVRAVEVLERIGALDARQLLQQLAQGAPGSRLTKESRNAVQRLEKSR